MPPRQVVEGHLVELIDPGHCAKDGNALGQNAVCSRLVDNIHGLP
jgi:hypothetical protein